MSKPLTVGIIAEGPTDYIVICEIIHHLMQDQRDVKFNFIQPEISAAFKQIQGPTGTGWSGVYRIIEVICEGGVFEITSNDFLSLKKYDVLIVLLDGDVARKTYESGHLGGSTFQNLPCEPIPCPLEHRRLEISCVKNCDVPNKRTAQIQQVLLDWMKLKQKSKNIVLCTPLDATEAWVLTALFPDENIVKKKKVECQENPANILKSKYKIDKTVDDYRDKVENKLRYHWQEVRNKCTAAELFSQDFLTGVK